MKRAKDRVGKWGTEPPRKGDVQEKIGEGKRRKLCSDPGLCEKEHDRGWSPPVHQSSGHQEPSEKWLERQTAQLSCLFMSTGPSPAEENQSRHVVCMGRAWQRGVNVDGKRGTVANKISASRSFH